MTRYSATDVEVGDVMFVTIKDGSRMVIQKEGSVIGMNVLTRFHHHKLLFTAQILAPLQTHKLKRPTEIVCEGGFFFI